MHFDTISRSFFIPIQKIMQQTQALDDAFWLFTQDSQIYLVNDELPFGTAEQFGLSGANILNIGTWRDSPLFLVFDPPKSAFNAVNLRSQLYRPENEFSLLNRGVMLNYFFQRHQFCGRCGNKTRKAEDEWAVTCDNQDCQLRSYPVICPSIIVAVRRGKQILLVNHLRHKEGMYTTLAGFVEAGETFEQTVHREVFEEVGIKVKNLRYFGSQPWAFPHSQMVGFLADYESGDIVLQESEIHDAKWFNYDELLPELPPKGTIALKLIEKTLQLCAEEN